MLNAGFTLMLTIYTLFLRLKTFKTSQFLKILLIFFQMLLEFSFNQAWLEPHNIRPGYWKFLLGVSGNK